eukprot:GHVT01038467.1.p1 GENE.GHVT01038467.1~~GHVT01038467.1.p1  ORF type:complete len:298 (+),score=54.35 GHVT01038467.1:122-1015(+)
MATSPVSSSVALPVTSSESSQETSSATSPVSPSPKFAQNHKGSATVRSADSAVVARSSPGKPPSPPSRPLLYFLPFVLAVAGLSGFAMTQHAKSLFGGHEAAPTLCSQGASVGKKASLPAVGAPPIFQVAAPLSAVAAFDGPSVSTSLPLAGAAKEANDSKASLSPSEWVQCLTLLGGETEKKTNGFLATQFGRRLAPVNLELAERCYQNFGVILNFARTFFVECLVETNMWTPEEPIHADRGNHPRDLDALCSSSAAHRNNKKFQLKVLLVFIAVALICITVAKTAVVNRQRSRNQ